MSNFLLGCALGAIFGILMAALCTAQKMCDNDLIARIDKARKSATDASHKACGTVIICGVKGEDFDDCPVDFRVWKTLMDDWRAK